MMLRLRTEIERTPLRQLVGCREGVLLLGSCFTDNIGGWMVDHWLPVMSNPWGVFSTLQALQILFSASFRRQQSLPSTCTNNLVDTTVLLITASGATRMQRHCNECLPTLMPK